jgi:hypothetical protein
MAMECLMPITPFLAGHTFDHDQIADMSAVLLAVCNKLGLADRADPLTEHVARTIVAFAQRGVRNPDALRKMTLQEFNVAE